jgi:tetratricopeptide (TPR) repeat protein
LGHYPFYLLLLCFWIPRTNQYIIEKLNALGKQSVFSFLKKHRYAIFAAISIIAGLCFYLLKIKYIFLGDTDDRATQIEEGRAGESEYFLMLALRPLYLFLHNRFEYTGVQTVRLVDYVTGGLFIFTSLCSANLLGNTFLKKLAVFVVSTLSLGILLQFCGYTEIYALPALFLQIYLLTCLLYLKDKTFIIVPALVLTAGVASHLLLVCMLPSFVFLFYKKILWKHPFFRNRKNILVLILLSLPFVYMAIKKFALPMMLPLQSQDGLFALFSITHIKEFINSQFLASGLGFLLWIVIIIYSLVHKLKYDDTLRFFLVSSLSIVGLMFVFRMDRGSGDWDILSFAAIVYTMTNACFLITAYEKKWYENIRYGILMIGGFSILHTSAWIATNKTDASIHWLEKAFATDPAFYYKVKYANEAMLSIVFYANGLNDLALEWGKKAYSKYAGDPRVGYNYALNLQEMGRNEEACSVIEQLLKTFPGYPLPYVYLIGHYYKIEDYNSLYRVLLQMEAVYKQHPEFFTERLPQAQIDGYFKVLADFKAQREQQK